MLLYRRDDGVEIPITGRACVMCLSPDGGVQFTEYVGGKVDATYVTVEREKAMVYATAIIGGFQPPRRLIRPDTRSAQTPSEPALARGL